MHGVPEVVCAPAADAGFGIGRDVRRIEDSERRRRAATTGERGAATRGMARTAVAECNQRRAACERSEEHTSELQSLMRISYAVFCLKKTINQDHNINNRLLHT